MTGVSFSVVVPTCGRDTLARSLASVADQLEPGDELLVRRADCDWGNESRDSLVRRSAGSHLLFLDDDDAYVEGALATIRRAVADDPDAIHVFRMRYENGLTLWEAPLWVAGQVGTPMVCVPNEPHLLGAWENEHGQLSDFAFFNETLRLRRDVGLGEVHWHEEVVALVDPSADDDAWMGIETEPEFAPFPRGGI